MSDQQPDFGSSSYRKKPRMLDTAENLDTTTADVNFKFGNSSSSKFDWNENEDARIARQNGNIFDDIHSMDTESWFDKWYGCP